MNHLLQLSVVKMKNKLVQYNLMFCVYIFVIMYDPRWDHPPTCGLNISMMLISNITKFNHINISFSYLTSLNSLNTLWMPYGTSCYKLVDKVLSVPHIGDQRGWKLDNLE